MFSFRSVLKSWLLDRGSHGAWIDHDEAEVLLAYVYARDN
jgi:hypothetical protein